MEIVRFEKFLRLSIFSVFAVLLVSACAPESSGGSGSDDELALGPNALTIELPAGRDDRP